MENSIYLKLILRGLVLLIAEKARDFTTKNVGICRCS